MPKQQRRALTVEWIEYDEEGDETTHHLPAKNEVCSRCGGRGSHVNPSVDGHGISAEEWDRDWDDESREDYFAGVYDVSCEVCKGERVVPVVDLERLEAGLRARYEEAQRREDRDRAERAHEIRMGY